MYIKLLYEFEQKEKLLRKKELRIKEIDKELQINDTIKKYKDDIAGLELAVKGFEQRKLEIEKDMDENESQLKSVTVLLDSNKLKTSKEIKAAKKTKENLLTKEDELKKSLEFIEDEIKAKKEDIEKVKEKIREAEESLKRFKEEQEELQKEIKEESAYLRKEFEKLAKSMPEEILRKYEEIKENFPFGAITTVDDGTCSNCGALIPLEMLEELKTGKGDHIILCEVCGKILYYPEELKK
jgi:predicted  nucleic acid-binding Zn-ribbon protein